MENTFPQRKSPRLKGFDYNSEYAYFVTICTKDRKCLLSHIVGTGVLTCPSVELTAYGEIAQKTIQEMNAFYNHISVDAFVVMPNHIHLLVRIIKSAEDNGSGQVGTPVPTTKTSALSSFVASFKRLCTKQYGHSIWQTRYYDHIIRDDKDYQNHLRYIDENPLKWHLDELYSET